jgi:putative transposase
MARLPRSALAEGQYFHVHARGVNGMAIFRDRDDRLEFLRLVTIASRRHRWRCHAFCLMDTHVHVVIEAALVRVSRGMHLVLGRYARHFNDRYARTGHLFGGRFGARLIADDEYLALAVDYVLHNPVRAGIVDAPQDWPWCGARRRDHAPPTLLESPAVDAATLAFRAS